MLKEVDGARQTLLVLTADRHDHSQGAIVGGAAAPAHKGATMLLAQRDGRHGVDAVVGRDRRRRRRLSEDVRYRALSKGTATKQADHQDVVLGGQLPNQVGVG